MRRSLGVSLCIFLLSLTFIFGCAAKKKEEMEIPEGSAGMIAYGSLISLSSMEGSLGHKYGGPVYAVHLKGYERAWACVRPWRSGPKRFDAYILRGAERVPIFGAAELNIFPDKRGRINGVLYLVTDEELRKFDEREWGYRRADVTDKVEEFRFRGGRVYVYEGLAGTPPASPEDQGITILMKEFRDSVTAACDARGEDFRAEFDRSTKPCAFPVVPVKDIVCGKAR
jgi:hypothetical protein